MGNCLLISQDDTKRISLSVGVPGDGDLKVKYHGEVFKKVRFADDKQYFGEDNGTERASPSVRIKVVISKKELREMIERGGVTIGDDVVNKSRLRIDDGKERADEEGFQGWKPGLESISEEKRSSSDIQDQTLYRWMDTHKHVEIE